MNPSRPVFLTPHLDVVGGTERQVQLLRRAFAGRGIAVPVVTRRPPSPSASDDASIVTFAHPLQDVLRLGRSLRDRLRGQPTRHGPQVSSPITSDLPVEDPHAPNLLRRVADRAVAGRIADAAANALPSPTILHLHGTFFHAMCRGARIAADRREVPLLVKIANEPDRVLSLLARDPAAYRAVCAADGLVAVNAWTETRLRELGLGPRIFHVPNAVEIPSWDPRPASGAALVFVGTLKQQKGVDVLLEAWARVPQGLRRAHPLRLVGDGSERAALTERASRLGIADEVTFVGTLRDPTVELRSARAFVLPSRWEGMPNALLEAMAYGLPCVATDIAGSRDILGAGDRGLTVPPEDPVALAGALIEVLEDTRRAEAAGLAARRYVVEAHAPERIVERLLETYRALGG